MSNGILTDQCQVVVRAPECCFEVSLPTDVPLAELLPSLVSLAGADEGGRAGSTGPHDGALDEQGLDHGGFVLQRLGHPALDEDLTPAALGLRTGETLHLRPRREQLPPVHYDDLVDGVASGLRERTPRWGPTGTRRLALGFGAAVLLAGLVPLAVAGPRPLSVLAPAVVAALLLLAAVAASRALGDGGAGTLLGLLALPCLFLTGWGLPAGGPDPQLLGARLLSGAAAGAGASVLALAAAATAAPVFCGTLLLCLFAAGHGALTLAFGMPPAEAAAPVAAVAVLFGMSVPVLSFRLAGMRLPPLPTDAQELQEGIDPVASQDVLERGALAEHFMTALYTATGLVCAGCLTALATGDGLLPRLLVPVLGLLLVLHARGASGVRQRLPIVLPGCYGLLLPLLGAARGDGGGHALVVLLIALAAAAALIVAGLTLPGRRLTPYWGRAADLAHSACAIALLPLVLFDIGVLPALRGLFSG
ncbi:type VII secretion integral membrane protein EccD [Streptomyces sp. NRRL S-1868]|uniref:type VII secretion integral membrane protein EccD n=1 Tax=Streptomyces sp. NRRL S-1868 TaxID=1463892 RepID=UPI0004C76D9B|nr:type VII secretion integral membrane protein EccD [Streptomyces sp. NRRL S-1868]